MTRIPAIASLFVVCIIGAVSEDTIRADQQELVDRFNRHRRQARRKPNGFVPSRVINYHFADDISDSSKELFMKAANAWEKDTCIKFKFDREAVDNILVRDDVRKSCLFKRSRTGKGNQTMYVGCRFFGGVAHELGHALWLDHTHKRHDRDDYLNVNWDNVKQQFDFVSRNFTGIRLERYREQYKKLTKLQNENYDVPYDYGSIMHYGSTGQYPPMTPKDKRYHRTMGSALISFTDLAVVNKHYKCDDICNSDTSARCARNGFPNPNNCSTCVCPGGYGGQLCEEKPDKCGKILNATTHWKNVSRAIHSKKEHGDYSKCTNWITSPHGTKIHVELLAVSGLEGLYAQGCIIAGIEIKTNKDQRLTGYRYCSKDDIGIKLESDSNLVPFITYSMNPSKFLNVTLRYRYVR